MGARRRGAVEAQGWRRRQVLRRLPRRRTEQHERRGGALSRLQPRARTADRPRTADQHVPRGPAAIDAACLREQGPARAIGVCGAAIPRHADRHRRRRAHQAVFAGRSRHVQPAAGTAQPFLRPVSRRQLGAEARRCSNSPGAADRLSALSAGMAGAGLAATAAAQLPGRDAQPSPMPSARRNMSTSSSF